MQSFIELQHGVPALAQGQLLALDANARRLRGLPRMAEQQGVPPGFLVVQAADLRAFAGMRQAPEEAAGARPFDRVLLDVPCSGLGVLSKRADLRWRRQPADLAALTRLQVRPDWAPLESKSDA
jgi:16S rRNA (cytosine967-C5)-methyltransferase